MEAGCKLKTKIEFPDWPLVILADWASECAEA
jgi:hypothetical protein